MTSVAEVRRTQTVELASRSGFTLVEVVVVVVMAAIVAGIAVPVVNIARYRTDSSVLELFSTLQASQRMAVLRGHTINIALDLEGDRYRIHNDENNDGIIDQGESIRWVPLGEGVTFGRGGATPLEGSSDQEGAHTFTRTQGDFPAFAFRRNGSGTEEGVLYITSGRSASSGAFPEETRAVAVSRATGRVSCFRNGSDGWREGC
jgi:prepilin-type N-terminal cleavage/methylation domain-containing protein